MSSEPLVGNVASLLLLMCGAHVDLFRTIFFCRAHPGAAPEWRPTGATGQLARWLLKCGASPTCSPPPPPTCFHCN